MNVRICFELYPRDQDGKRAEPFGLTMIIGEGEANQEIDYGELSAAVNKTGILQMAGLDSLVRPEDMNVITPEQYDEKYGDKNV